MIFILSFFSSLLTFYLNSKLGAIRSSIATTLGLALCIYLFSTDNFNQYLYILYGASFIGMTGHKRASYKSIVLSSVLFSLIYKYLITYFPKVGGTLGLKAFLSVSIVYFLSFLKFKLVRLKAS